MLLPLLRVVRCCNVAASSPTPAAAIVRSAIVFVVCAAEAVSVVVAAARAVSFVAAVAPRVTAAVSIIIHLAAAVFADASTLAASSSAVVAPAGKNHPVARPSNLSDVDGAAAGTDVTSVLLPLAVAPSGAA